MDPEGEGIHRGGLQVKRLTFRERTVLELRMGTGDDGFTYTLEECGRIFRVTREMIRSVERKAYLKLWENYQEEMAFEDYK